MKARLKKWLHKLRDIGLLIYKSGDNMVDHDGVEHAGYLSFLTLLAFFPFLVFFVAILGALGQTGQGDQFIHMLISNAPRYAVEAIEPRIDEILSGPPHGLLTISILGTIWTSSSIVHCMRTILNRAYHVHTPRSYYFRRAISIVHILLLAVLLIFTMIVLIIVPIIFTKLYGLFFTYQAVNGGGNFNALPHPTLLLADEWEFLRYLGVALVLLAFVSMLYYVLPNVKHKWRHTLPGSLITVVGWVLTGKGMSYYLINFSQVNVVYGSLTNIIIFLLFFYIINIIFIYGAEFNYLLEKYLGHKLVQKENVAPEEIKPTEQMNRVVTKDEIVVPDEKKHGR